MILLSCTVMLSRTFLGPSYGEEDFRTTKNTCVRYACCTFQLLDNDCNWPVRNPQAADIIFLNEEIFKIFN